MTRSALAVLAALALATPALASAQDPINEAYTARKKRLNQEVEESRKRLTEVRGQRLQLQARIEAVIARVLEERAQQLLLSREGTALKGIDSVLTASQESLAAQRDRFVSLGDAVRRRSGAVLVVVLRADSSSQTQMLSAASVTVDNGAPQQRSYNVASNGALAGGAVDQIYRADVLPTSHVVAANVTVNGQALTQSVTVNAAAESVTYVQFAVRNGQIVQTTWSSRGTTPF